MQTGKRARRTTCARYSINAGELRRSLQVEDDHLNLCEQATRIHEPKRNNSNPRVKYEKNSKSID